MEILSRIEQLSELLRFAGGNIPGRKKFHKMVFLLQKSGFDFGQDFEYHHYGVYSTGLASDLRYMKANGIVTETEFPLGEFSEFEISLVKPYGNSLLSGSAGFEAAVEELRKMSARDLEVLSTIVYLREHGYSGDSLTRQLQALKGSIIDASRLPALLNHPIVTSVN